MTLPIPDIVVRRLALYLRCIQLLIASGHSVASSQEMASQLGVTPAQIRKDLSYFGEFGKQGIGYDLQHLQDQLERILHVDRVWPVILVGAGALGRALANYGGFIRRGFAIVAAFDSDADRIGRRIGDLVVRDIKEIGAFIHEKKIEIAILAVPADAAQKVALSLADLGIKAILNYAPVSLNMPPGIQVRYIDPAASLQSMTYYLDREQADRAD